MKRYLISFLFLIFLCPIGSAEDIFADRIIGISSRVDKGFITIGDKVRYSIVVESSDAIEFELSDFGENLGGFAIKDFGREDMSDHKKEYWYVLDTYVTGSYVIPPAKLTFWKAKNPTDKKIIFSSSLFVEVRSLLEGEKLSDIKDIKRPVTIEVSYKKYYLIGTGILICIVLVCVGVYLFFRFRKKKQIEAQAYVRPAHEVAYDALNAILAQELIKSGKFKEYYYLISNVIRRYIEQRFEIMALELTTEEFLVHLSKEKNVLAMKQKSILKEFLTVCDMVKFAKYGPSLKEAEEVYRTAKSFIDETRLELKENDDEEDD